MDTHRNTSTRSDTQFRAALQRRDADSLSSNPRNLSPSNTTPAVSTDHLSPCGDEIDTRGEQPKGDKNMFIRKHWLPLSVFLVAIAAVSLYVLQTDTPKAPMIYKATTPAEAQEQRTPDGHFHEDGTFHAEPHTEEDGKAEIASDKVTEYEKLLVEKEQLKAAIDREQQKLKEQNEEYQKLLGRYEELKEQRAIREEVKAFDTWVSTINFQEEFGELLALPSLPSETIRELYTPEELETLVSENVARFNAFREEFLTRLENCSPEAREIIESHIHASPELSQIYAKYIENPFVVSGGVQ